MLVLIFLAPANAYGTNSAIVSGQGVPQWYGSAEVNEVVMSMTMMDETHVGMRHRGPHCS